MVGSIRSWRCPIRQTATAKQDGASYSAVAADAVTGRCFDVNYTNALAAGTYTVTIQKFANFAIGSNLSDGFVFDGASFQDFRNGFVDVVGDKRDSHWAFDILGVDTAVVVPSAGVPEPASLGIGVMAMVRRKCSKATLRGVVALSNYQASCRSWFVVYPN